jgi:hypothetical protein
LSLLLQLSTTFQDLVLDTLMEALDYYEAQGKADKAQLADVRRWLESYPFDDHIDMEERNALLEAIAESEKKKRKAFIILPNKFKLN